jgi:hypothetical protein
MQLGLRYRELRSGYRPVNRVSLKPRRPLRFLPSVLDIILLLSGATAPGRVASRELRSATADHATLTMSIFVMVVICVN